MHKKSQLSSQVFVYALSMIVVSMILIIGYKYLGSINNAIDKSSLLQFQNKLFSDMKNTGKEFGSEKKIEYSLPKNVESVCFADLSKKEQILSTKLIDFYPLMVDSIKSGLQKNIFFAGSSGIVSFYSKEFVVDEYPYIKCFSNKDGKIELALEGKGSGISSVSANFIKAKIAENDKTILKSNDGVIEIEVPKDSGASTDYIKVGITEPMPGFPNRASDAYRLEPAGATFSKPVELRIRYNPKITGNCPEKLSFYQYDKEGIVRVKTPSKSIDCDNKIAYFDIVQFV